VALVLASVLGLGPAAAPAAAGDDDDGGSQVDKVKDAVDDATGGGDGDGDSDDGDSGDGDSGDGDSGDGDSGEGDGDSGDGSAAVEQQSVAPSVQETEESDYQPPLHGDEPHGQGTLATVDVDPSEERPLAGDPSGDESNEEVVVGRARGEQQDDGSYHGHVTPVALFGNEVGAIDTEEGESSTGPLGDVNQALDELCANTDVCVEVLDYESETTETGSNNRFVVASAEILELFGATAGESEGNISEDGDSQESEGSSTVVGSSLMGEPLAAVSHSSTRSEAGDNGSTQENDSFVLGLFGDSVVSQEPDLVIDVLGLGTIVLNADDTNGEGEEVEQADDPYGVREALTVFVLPISVAQLDALVPIKVTTAASESHAVAPEGDGGGGGDGGGDGNGDGGDGDGDGGGDGNGNGNGNGDGDGDGADSGPAAFTGSLGPIAETPGARPGPRAGTPRRRGGPRRPGGARGPRGGGPGGPADGGPGGPDEGRLVTVADTGGGNVSDDRAAEALPRTGLEAWLLALLGALLLAGGLALRRSERGGVRS
jgi:LPXTG-motif cell wall-anchored protein